MTRDKKRYDTQPACPLATRIDEFRNYFDLNQTPANAGACNRYVEPTRTAQRPPARLKLGTVRFSKETGELLD